MKKLLTSVMALTALTCGVLATTTACGGAKTYELALVTDVGDIDDESFNQSAWEAVKEYGKDNNKTYNYYRPTEDSTTARVTAMELAIKKGAKVVVCPGYLFEAAIYSIQSTYPDVNFVLLDGEPHSEDYSTYETKSNVTCMLYQEEIAGYLAGYATVADGYTKLGFCGGMAVPAVQRYGYGFLQGANAAAAAKEIQISANYYYAGAFQATDEATANMTSWYTAGTEVVFACGGKVYQSVAEGSTKVASSKWIGVDVDQHSVDPDKVLTSAMKDLKTSVISALEIYYAGNWDKIGGKTANLGLNTVLGTAEAKDYVGIPTSDASWGFTSFTKDQYNTLLSNIKSGAVTISNTNSEAAPTFTNLTVSWTSEIGTF
jgi:basic membrane protein A